MILIPYIVLALDDNTDREFMVQIYEEYSYLMYSIAISVLKDHQDAQDAVNDTIVQLIGKIPLLRHKNSYVLRSYIISTVRRTSINALVKRNKRIALTPTVDAERLEGIPDKDIAVDSEAIANATQGELMAALAALPESERDLLRWKYFEELTDDEISKIMGIRKNSVRTYLTRARRHMRRLLERQDMENAE